MKRVSGFFDPDILAIVKELDSYRMVMGVPIKALARRSGISDYAIRRWFGLQRQPDMIDLKILAESMGYKIKVILEVPE